MRKIEPYQMRKLYAIGKALSMSEPGNRDDDLHVLVAGTTGKDSIKELSYQEAAVVIRKLESLQAPAGKQEQPVTGGITEGQQKKIWALMYELKKYDSGGRAASLGERLCGMIKKELGVDSVPENPFAWIDFTSGNRIIETLKKYIASAKKRVG